MPYYFCVAMDHKVKDKYKQIKPGDLVPDSENWNSIDDWVKGGIIEFSDLAPKEYAKKRVFTPKPFLSRRAGTLKKKTKAIIEVKVEPEPEIEKMTPDQIQQQKTNSLLMAQMLSK